METNFCTVYCSYTVFHVKYNTVHIYMYNIYFIYFFVLIHPYNMLARDNSIKFMFFKELEKAILRLFSEKTLYQSELGKQKQLCEKLEMTLEANRKKTAQFHKEVCIFVNFPQYTVRGNLVVTTICRIFPVFIGFLLLFNL